MATVGLEEDMEKQRKTQNVRKARPKRLPKKSWIDEAWEHQERILAAHGGKLFPDSTPDIRAMREGRVR